MHVLRFRLGYLPLAVILIAGGALSVQAVDDSFPARVSAAEDGASAGAASRAVEKLEALVVEAMAAGDHEARVLAGQALARVHARSGNSDAARDEVDDALRTARQFGLSGFEVSLSATYADVLLAAGDPDLAAEWLGRGYREALAQSPPQVPAARESLVRLAAVRRALGQEPLALQAETWLALLAAEPDAPAGVVELQPMAARVQVGANEVGRTRLTLTNATAVAVTGTLWLDTGAVSVKEWKSRPDSEWIVLQLAPADPTASDDPTRGRRITLQPGEQRHVTVETEPATPPQVAERRVTFSWQSGDSTIVSELDFYFVPPHQLRDPSAANASHLRLNPLVSIPVYQEIYCRNVTGRRIESFLPLASAPSRIEVYELGRVADGDSRVLLAVDGNGDGRFDGIGDSVFSDNDRDGFPDVTFTPQKSVAAIEFKLYPLPVDEGGAESLDLSISLRSGGDWRDPPDSINRVDVR